jgi:hypothetical protein
MMPRRMNRQIDRSRGNPCFSADCGDDHYCGRESRFTFDVRFDWHNVAIVVKKGSNIA